MGNGVLVTAENNWVLCGRDLFTFLEGVISVAIVRREVVKEMGPRIKMKMQIQMVKVAC